MKGFLFDENIPSRLIFTPSLPIFDTSILGQSPSDTMLWEVARANSYVIVTNREYAKTRISPAACQCLASSGGAAS